MKKSLVIFGISALILAGCNSNTPQVEEQSVSDIVTSTILARQSIRAYKDTPVEREKMDLILKCGIHAPNGMNAQPWEIRVVDSKDYLDGITKLWMEGAGEMAERESQNPSFRNMFRNAPTVVFICNKEDQGQIDCGLLGENMIIAAQSMGIGSCCLGGPVAFMRGESAKPYVDRLQLPEGYSILYAIGFGYPDETPEMKPRDETKIKYID